MEVMSVSAERDLTEWVKERQSSTIATAKEAKRLAGRLRRLEEERVVLAGDLATSLEVLDGLGVSPDLVAGFVGESADELARLVTAGSEARPRSASRATAARQRRAKPTENGAPEETAGAGSPALNTTAVAV